MALRTPTAAASLALAESSAHRWNHEVFLSFRGVDTRKGITSDIYDRLQNMRGIKTFMDNHELEVGDVISPRLLTAIEESRFAIVVLSQHYASSTWCLEELTTIFQCMKDKNRILPLFYQVDPSHVRYQKGSFEDAFRKHESRQGIAKVKQWKIALEKVANLSGWDSNNYGSDKELVEDIVKLVWSKVLQVRIENESTRRDFEVFEATRLAMDKIMKALQDDQVAVIGVYGMGGVGKTILVKHVGAQARENGLFDKVIMAVVSQSVNLKTIQAQLAEMLALKLAGDTEVGRAYVLKEAIMRGNKILIILDDIWKKVELSSIGIPSNDELQKCNSKILLTTRIRNVCLEMDSQAKINLSILSDEDSLNLFLKKARMAFHESTEIYNVASKVARKCAGLPVALIAVAKALGDKDLDEWNEAAQRLQASQPADPEDEKHVFECIKLSYDYLRSNDAKSCFLLCCLFPEDYNIPIEDLLKYGIGKGLFQDSNTMQEARARAELVVKSLKASSLLLDTEEKRCVRMHDVIRDVAISISSSENGQRILVKAGCEVKDWPRINARTGYSAISLMKNKICKLPQALVCSKLHILLLQRNTGIKEVPETFFQSPNELRVLDLSNTSISLLPQSFNLLTNLQALFLDRCDLISDISILGKLDKLEILSMRECYPQEFPKEIGQLTTLRMLDITRLEVGTIPSQVITRLIGLEELYMKCDFICGSKVERAGDETNVCFEELIGLPYLNNLEVFIHDAECLPQHVEFHPNWVNFDICINRLPRVRSRRWFNFTVEHGQSRALTLNTAINTLPDWFNNVVTERAEKLQYYDCKDLSNVLVEYGTGRLHGLKYLDVLYGNDDKKLKELMNTVTYEVPDNPVFENLAELHVELMPSLKELCVGELPLGSLRNLNLLNVSKCQGLENALLSSNLLQRLQNLENLFCRYLPRIEYVFGAEGIEPEEIMLAKLRKIHLKSLDKLIDICRGPAPRAIFQNLKSLVLDNCPELKYVFTTCTVQCFVQLELLYVYDCESLQTVIEASEETVNNIIICFPRLTKLFLVSLPQLTRFYGTTGTIISCPLLEQMGLQDLPQFSDTLSDFRSSKPIVFCDNKQIEFQEYILDEESRIHDSDEFSRGQSRRMFKN